MKLYIIKHKTSSKVYYRFLSPAKPNPYIQSTGVKERAALFLDMSAAQDVCDELFIAGHKNYVVADFESE